MIVGLFYRWEPLRVSHYPAKFGGRRHCGSRDMFKRKAPDALALLRHCCLFLKDMG